MMTTQAHTLPEEHYLNAGYGWRSWLLTTDHKRIAILYLISITAMFPTGVSRHSPPTLTDSTGPRRHRL